MEQDSSYISIDEFEILSSFIYRKSGIKLENNKAYFMNNRVQKRLKDLNFASISDYIRYLKFSDRDGKELQQLLNQVTINETFFFRDYPQLEAFVECLKDVVNKKMETNHYSLNIWSAGCSTGEEPYTLSIILHEILDDIDKWKVKIIASDIDEEALHKAESGIYDYRSLKETPEEYINTYFSFEPSINKYSVQKNIRSKINFEHLNLNDKHSMRSKNNFDIIFCRNVLIYFDDESRKRAVEYFYSALNKNGYIFLGSSESMGRITSAFKLLRINNKYLVYSKE